MREAQARRKLQNLLSYLRRTDAGLYQSIEDSAKRNGWSFIDEVRLLLLAGSEQLEALRKKDTFDLFLAMTVAIAQAHTAMLAEHRKSTGEDLDQVQARALLDKLREPTKESFDLWYRFLTN